MSGEDKKKPNEIDELLGDYKKQRERREKNFESLNAPESEKKEQPPQPAADEKEKKRRKRGEKGEKEKSGANEGEAGKGRSLRAFAKTKSGRIIVALVSAALCAAAVAAAGLGIITNMQTAYLDEYKKQYPDVDFPRGIREGYCAQYAEEPSTTGFLSIEATGYGAYVVQSAAGDSPRLSFDNTASGIDFNTVLDVPAETGLEGAFHSVSGYLGASQKITYSTLFEDYDFTVIGAFYTNTDPADDGGYVFPYRVTKKMTPLSFNDYADRLYNRFLYTCGYTISRDDRLLSLACPSALYPDYEFVVIGVLGAPQQTSAAENHDAHFPQSWYDARGELNPYRFSEIWYPTVYTDEKEEQTSVQSASEYGGTAGLS